MTFIGFYPIISCMKFSSQSISFHPRLAAGLDLFLGLIFLWWLTQVSAWWVLLLWLFFRLLLWATLVRLVYFSGKIKRWSHYLSLTIFGLGVAALLIFMDWPLAWLVVGGAFVIFPALSFWFLPIKEMDLSFESKPYRRWRFLLAVFGLIGVESGFTAVAAFQLFNNINNLVWWGLAGAIAALTAVWWWREYGVRWNRRMAIWSGVFFLLLLEFIGIVMFWPLGYLAGALIICWWWYVGWLMIRFHLSKDGIIWKKQRWFLAINGLAMLIFLLLLVRWK